MKSAKLELAFVRAGYIEKLFDWTLAELNRAGLHLIDGTTLHLKTDFALDLGTLPEAAKQFNTYLQLKVGEIAIGNDPYCGGTHIGDITLVTKAYVGKDRLRTEVLISTRFELPIAYAAAKNIEDEGLRIPPTPCGEIKNLNTGLLQAIQAHPQCPPGFYEQVLLTVEALNEVTRRVQQQFPSPDEIAQYLECAQTAQRQQMAKLSLGEFRMNSKLSADEVVKLRLEVKEDRLAFDFSGTEASQQTALTDRMTFGLCVQALTSLLKSKGPYNSGTFSLIEVRTPKHTCVSARAPQATGLGATEGALQLFEICHRALMSMNKHLREADGPRTLSSVSVASEKLGQTWIALGGKGASAEKNGAHAFPEIRPQLKWSAEALEATLPYRVESAGLAYLTSGKGLRAGGAAEFLTLKFLAPAKINVLATHFSHRPHGIEKGRAGHQIDLSLKKADSTEKPEPLNTGQSHSVNADDVLHIQGSGGGAYGESKASAADEED